MAIPIRDGTYPDLIKTTQIPVTEWRAMLCRFAWHTWTMWMINYDPPTPELGWTRQRRQCVICGRHQEASLL